MRLLFPADAARPGRIDPDWVEESEAAAAEGIASGVIDLEALSRGDATEATRRVRPGAGDRAIFRGPALDPAQRDALSAALDARGLRLEISPDVSIDELLRSG